MGKATTKRVCWILCLVLVLSMVPAVFAAEAETELFDISGSSMTLGNTLEINFAIDTTKLTGTDNYIVISKEYADDRGTVTKTIQQSDWTYLNASTSYVSYSVSAKEMNDKLTVIVYNAAGEQLTKTYEDSVAAYCLRTLAKEEAKSSPEAKKLALFVDMLVYGAAAQTEWSYNTDALADAKLTEAQKGYATQIGEKNNLLQKGVGYYGTSLSLEENILMNVAYNASQISDASYAEVTFVDHYGNDKTVTVQAEEFLTQGDNLKYISITVMAVADYSQAVTVTLYDAEGNAISTTVDSVESYLSRKTGALYDAIAAFGVGAYNYFHTPETSDPDTGDNTTVITGTVSAEDGTVTEDASFSDGDVSAQVPAGVQVEDSTLTLTVTEKSASDSGVALEEGQEILPLDIHIDGVSAENATPIQVCLGKILPNGLNIGNVTLYHVEDGVANAMTRVMTLAELNEHNEFYYDPATGDITVAMASFSEVALVANEANPWNGEIDTGWYNDTDTVFEIFNADELAGLGKLVDDGNTFEGKTVKMCLNIDLYGMEDDGETRRSFDPIGYGYDIVFKGTFDGNGNTISNLYQNGWDLGLSYDTAGGGLFASAVDAEFKNLTLDNAYIVMECIDMGTLVGYAYGTCNFENIVVSDSTIANYNRYTGGVIGEVNGTHTLTNVDVDAGTTLSALWGTFDPSIGGIIGGKWGEATVTMKACDVACKLDVFNDVTSAYQWYSYRRCGMLIGYTEESETVNGRTQATASFLTTEDCTVSYGDWVNYHYCEFATTNNSGYRYPFVRSEEGLFNDAYSNPRYGHPGDKNGNLISAVHDEATTHAEGEAHELEIVFNQLYGGGQGCYGGNGHVGKGVTVITAPEAAEKFTGKGVVSVLADTTVTLGDLFAESGLGSNIKNFYVHAYVSPATEDSRARGSFARVDLEDWTQNTLTFTGSGEATVTITDYYYCNPTTIQVQVWEPLTEEAYTGLSITDVEEGKGNILKNGYYYLTEDTVLKDIVDLRDHANIVIDLKGHKLTGHNIEGVGKGVDARLFRITGNSKVTVLGEGSLVAGDTHNTAVIAWVYGEGSSFNMAGGTIDCEGFKAIAYEGTGITEQGDGGAIYVGNKASVVLDGVTIQNATAAGIYTAEAAYKEGGNGGAIYATGGAIVELNNTVIKNCEAAANGGAIYADGSTVTVTGGSVSGGNATNGGAVYAISNSKVDLDGVTVQESSAAASGGAIFAHNTPVTVENSTITECTAESGGAIFSGSGTNITTALTVTDTNITSCSVTGNGGAIAAASGASGAIINVTVNGSTEISGCESGTNGGAVYINVGSLAISDTVSVHNNESKNQGGAIYLSGTNVTATMSGGDIYENTTANGGAVNIGSDTNSFNLIGGKIRNNVAGSYLNGTGETVYSNVCGVTVHGTFNMTGGEVSNNIGLYDETTGEPAGGVHWSDITGSGEAKIVISGGTVISHTDARYAVRVYEGTAAISDNADIQGKVRFDYGNVTITGGYVTAVFGGNEEDESVGYNGTITVTGGTFHEDISEYVAAGYMWVWDAESSTGTVVICDGHTYENGLCSKCGDEDPVNLPSGGTDGGDSNDGEDSGTAIPEPDDSTEPTVSEETTE